MGIRKRRLWIAIGCIMCIWLGGCSKLADGNMEVISEERKISETTETVSATEESFVEQTVLPPIEQQVVNTEEIIQTPQSEAETAEAEILEESEEPQVTQKPETVRGLLQEEDSVRIQVPESMQVLENNQESVGISVPENNQEILLIPESANTSTPVHEEQSYKSEEVQKDMESQEHPSSKEENHIHNFEKAIWELPTCQKGGYYNNVCTDCGQVECVTQEALPHEAEDIIIQQGNCMNDTVIQHICINCGVTVSPDTRYTEYNIHHWVREMVDGQEIEYCQDCGVQK